jgi:sulfur carrier protein
MIDLVVNGETQSLPQSTSVAAALLLWGYQCEKIAVAINGEFVARGNYENTQLHAGDRLDVVAPVQGG